MPALIGIPSSIKAEHEEIHGELDRATRLGRRVGETARELMALVNPHFAREEEIALPPLGLLAPLARGEYDPTMEQVLPAIDALRAELPGMLDQHEAIAAVTRRLRQLARAAGNERLAQAAGRLLLHARAEEDVFYPAAILVGDLVRFHAGMATELP